MKEIEITVPVGRQLTEEQMQSEARRQMGLPRNAELRCVVTKRSIDARKDVLWRYRIEAYGPGDEYVPYQLPQYLDVSDAVPVIVVGAGPAGMFAALKLLTLGLKPIVLERGKDVHRRKSDMAVLSKTGAVNPDSNYCYGEGGAGAFSDGKLFTRSSKRGDIREVLYQLVKFGAKEDILIDAHPHIGSDKLPIIVENIRKCVIEHGGEYHFDSKVIDISANDCNCATLGTMRGGTACGGVCGADVAEDTSHQRSQRLKVKTADGKEYSAAAVILATGHSARDIYEMLDSKGCTLEPKGFALGVRVEHPQSLINNARYHGRQWPDMPAAEYSFVEQIEGRGVFSFCMCPGGILVPSSTEPESTVLNGMSNSARNSKWANAGVVVQIEPEDIPHEYDRYGAFSVMNFQRDVERKMYAYSKSKGTPNPMAAPAQRMKDFCRGIQSANLPKTSYFPGAISAPLHELLPDFVYKRMRLVFPVIDRKIHGYYTNDALLLGIESRTSSPIRIPRDAETLQSPQIPGLFPCGEGAGFAGGIVSSAIDGIRCAIEAAKTVTDPIR